MYSRGRRVLILLSRLLPFKSFVAVNIRRAFKPGFPPSEIAHYIAQAQATPRKVVMGRFAGMRRFDVLDRAGELKLPMLILHGFYDVQFPLQQALAWRSRFPTRSSRYSTPGTRLPPKIHRR